MTTTPLSKISPRNEFWRGLMILTLLISSCNSHSSYNRDIEIEKFLKKTKNEDLLILLNVSFTARGINEYGSYSISQLTYETESGNKFVIPNLWESRDINDLDSIDSSNLVAFSDFKKMSLSETQKFTKEISRLAEKLSIGKVVSTPRFGEVILFYLTDKDRMLYIPDSSKVKTSYWQEIIKRGTKTQDNWYLITGV